MCLSQIEVASKRRVSRASSAHLSAIRFIYRLADIGLTPTRRAATPGERDPADRRSGRAPSEAMTAVAQAEEAIVPVGFLVGVLRTRLGRAAVSDLLIALAQPLPPGELRQALA